MAVKQLQHQPDQYAHFPAERYQFLRLHNREGEYGVAAVAEHPEAMEVHLELSRFGPSVLRSLKRDAAWLRRYALKRGKTRLIGIRQEHGAPDPRWPKFTRLFGFGSHAVVQTAFAELTPEPGCATPGPGSVPNP